MIKFEDLLTLVALVVTCFFFTGCAHAPQTVELQCTSPAIRESIEGPVIMKDDAYIFYDSHGKLRKISGTCGVR